MRPRLLATAVMIAVGGLCLRGTAERPPQAEVPDAQLYLEVTAAVRGGASYYDALRVGLEEYGYFRGSVFNWRLPTLAVFEASLPSMRFASGLLIALGFATVAMWIWHFRELGWVAGVLFVLAWAPQLPLPIDPGLATFHELWAGLLICASMAARAVRQRGVSVALGGAAAAIRELAILYILVSLWLAWREGRRREALGWIGVIVGFGAYFAWHWWQVSAQGTLGASAPNWLVYGGWCAVLRAARTHLAVFLMPAWGVVLTVPFVVVGWSGLAGSAGRHVSLTSLAYVALLLVTGLPLTWYWGFMVAPLFPLAAIGWCQVWRDSSRRVSPT